MLIETFFWQSHYSIKKASAALGFGTENLILLRTDERLRFIFFFLYGDGDWKSDKGVQIV